MEQKQFSQLKKHTVKGQVSQRVTGTVESTLECSKVPTCDENSLDSRVKRLRAIATRIERQLINSNNILFRGDILNKAETESPDQHLFDVLEQVETLLESIESESITLMQALGVN